VGSPQVLAPAHVVFLPLSLELSLCFVMPLLPQTIVLRVILESNESLMRIPLLWQAQRFGSQIKVVAQTVPLQLILTRDRALWGAGLGHKLSRTWKPQVSFRCQLESPNTERCQPSCRSTRNSDHTFSVLSQPLQPLSIHQHLQNYWLNFRTYLV